MAAVYKAFDIHLERDVAIKLIRRDAIPPELLETVLKRFEREAKSLARLSHPNIVKIHDYGEYEGAPYLVMEYVRGGTLKDKTGQPIPYPDAARLILPIARALDHAHRQGILHRDVKPSNILITEGNETLLTDFGIAKILKVYETLSLTGTGMGIGTPDYMAPEQGLGEDIDGRVDIYALGVVLYELVTGRKPFVADTPMAVVLKHVTDPPPPPKRFNPELPDDVEEVLFKALAKKPDDRFQDMGAMITALTRLAQIGHTDAIPALEPDIKPDVNSNGLQKSQLHPDALYIEDPERRLTARINRLENVIAEMLAVKDIEGAEALVATLESMGERAKQRSIRWRVEIERRKSNLQSSMGSGRLSKSPLGRSGENFGRAGHAKQRLNTLDRTSQLWLIGMLGIFGISTIIIVLLGTFSLLGVDLPGWLGAQPSPTNDQIMIEVTATITPTVTETQFFPTETLTVTPSDTATLTDTPIPVSTDTPRPTETTAPKSTPIPTRPPATATNPPPPTSTVPPPTWTSFPTWTPKPTTEVPTPTPPPP
jgi:serine/threonine protein kinase